MRLVQITLSVLEPTSFFVSFSAQLPRTAVGRFGSGSQLRKKRDLTNSNSLYCWVFRCPDPSLDPTRYPPFDDGQL